MRTEDHQNHHVDAYEDQLHLARGRGAEAVSIFRTVVAERPEAANGYLFLGQAHLMNKETDLAIDVLNQGLRRWQLQQLELQEPLPSLSSR